MQEPTPWSDLLLKFLENNISEAELEELERQMASAEWKKQQFLRINDPDQFKKRMKAHSLVDNDKGWDKLTKMLPELKGPVVVPFYKKTFFKRAVAVCVVVMIGLLVFIVLPSHQPITARTMVIEINKKRIELDTLRDGVILELCYARVIKDGSLYKIEKSAVFDVPACTILSFFTPPGKTLQIEFSDGSAVTLNAGSSISFPAFFTSHARNVTLHEGEAFFNIKNENNTPFEVNIPGKPTVQVLGTKFNINTYEDSHMTATLIEGKIKLISADTNLLLTPGQQALIQDKKLTVIDNINIERVKAWTKDVFDFKDLNLQQMLKEMEHWYGCEIIYKGKPSGITYAGEIQRSLPVREAIKALLIDTDLELNKDIIIKDTD